VPSPFGPPRLWAKHMGLKRGATGTPLGNILETHWELEREQRKNEKKSSPLPPHPKLF